MDATVVHVPENDRYEVRVGGETAGYAEYMGTQQVTVFTHTEIDDKYEGQGLGGILAKGALDSIRSQGRGVLTLCPFIKGWIDRHPEYADLLVEEPDDVGEPQDEDA
ncbi:GNAT family N-acetyltransferase [Yinghuangia sp. YIM S10712]|uniref:GNAT family N-acetyltransferase n=1 Tax=Yinghuangia sp. YIM S10712 TaxID=3436930 RepID=UPI003F5372EC